MTECAFRKIARTLLAAALLPHAIVAAAPAGDWRSDVDAFARRVVDSGLAPGLALSSSGSPTGATSISTRRFPGAFPA